MTGNQSGRFPETSWGLVQRATDLDAETKHQALSDLCQTYWPPLYAFARHQGHSPPDAEDLIQGFVAHLIEEETLKRVDPGRGRLRTFLLGAFKRFMAREHQRQSRLKRGGGQTTVSLDRDLGEQHFHAIPATDLPPDAVFDRHWMVLLFDRMLQQLRAQYEQKKKLEHFEVFKHFLDDRENQSYESASEALGISSGAARVAVHRFTRTYRQLLANEIRETLTDSEEAESEFQYLTGMATA